MPIAYGLIEPVELQLPHLPANLEGLRIAHITDLHVTRPTRRLDRLISHLASIRIDLIFLTGDYITRKNHEKAGVAFLNRLCQGVQPNIGMIGVFGNHDTPRFRRFCDDLPIRWLSNQACRLSVDRDDSGVSGAQAHIDVFGLDGGKIRGADSVALAIDYIGEGNPSGGPDNSRPLRMMLSHYPNEITTASDLGVDLMFAGHTHGGQWCLPTGRALMNSSDLPLRLSSGLLRHRNMLVMISRGLGEVMPRGFPRFRLFCSPHVPLYTLRCSNLPGRYCEEIELIRKW